ncbi:hypothetical protein [Alkaliphilus peptidifermentans]|uniref:Uncharacterized protein n=1 Tax=Alkaliphilus peptidifermentans DSM 18978 TaxID=1120976 RepID=A0A1G5AQ43_9FIRM|nr:hypothetical protein [Alkaliphilus peptidifermentans]SCX80013.1 hypothetical protein SAMN03080606_00243 [Alkaliphilus peptidifermentans DSM 18978]
MKNENHQDVRSMNFANLTQEQLTQLKKAEDEINSNRENKVFLMAMID